MLTKFTIPSFAIPMSDELVDFSLRLKIINFGETIYYSPDTPFISHSGLVASEGWHERLQDIAS